MEKQWWDKNKVAHVFHGACQSGPASWPVPAHLLHSDTDCVQWAAVAAGHWKSPTEQVQVQWPTQGQHCCIYWRTGESVLTIPIPFKGQWKPHIPLTFCVCYYSPLVSISLKMSCFHCKYSRTVAPVSYWFYLQWEYRRTARNVFLWFTYLIFHYPKLYFNILVAYVFRLHWKINNTLMH